MPPGDLVREPLSEGEEAAGLSAFLGDCQVPQDFAGDGIMERVVQRGGTTRAPETVVAAILLVLCL